MSNVGRHEASPALHFVRHYRLGARHPCRYSASVCVSSGSNSYVHGSEGRMLLDKRFEGDLVGTGKGEMLTALTSVKGSAGYVAIERVAGTLHGRSGAFVFQHSGSMNRGAQQLSITVVPDSGTGALVGISGTFKLNIVDGKHFYEFEYSLPQ
ncbi:MAG: DUF3224 domain-containing protein [Acidobacteria bacterium]|nr:MAG: DUF3224 domain-containing protein [Acidobacteriota bacterium]